MARGYVLKAPGELAVNWHDLPALPPDWARIRFLYCGLCGSDLAEFHGRHGAEYPISIGHEFVAEVVETGSEVQLIVPGDIVTSDLNYRCGDCDHCLAGRSHLCRIGQQALFTNRAFSELGDIEVSYLTRFEGSAAPHLALCEPLSCVLHAKDLAAPQPGERMLVIGAGGLGLCLTFALCNQQPALNFDVTDRATERLERLASAIAPIGNVITRPEGEYDVVFDLTGTEGGLRFAGSSVRDGGTICSMGHPLGEEIDPTFLSAVLPKDVTFATSYLNGEPAVLREAARLLERQWSRPWNEMIDLLPLGRLRQAFEQRPGSTHPKTVIDVAAGFD